MAYDSETRQALRATVESALAEITLRARAARTEGALRELVAWRDSECRECVECFGKPLVPGSSGECFDCWARPSRWEAARAATTTDQSQEKEG